MSQKWADKDCLGVSYYRDNDSLNDPALFGQPPIAAKGMKRQYADNADVAVRVTSDRAAFLENY